MKKSGFLLSVLIALTLLAATGEADAARLGGGRSFGSRPSYSMPYSRPSSPSASPAQPAYQQPSMAEQQNQAARAAMSNRGGLMGMLGGLALGGLLGAMLFGGAFEHINFMDILLFGGIAFLLFKLFAARRTSNEPQSVGAGYYGPQEPPAYQRSSSRAGFDTDILSGRGGFKPSRGASLPADFDAAAFLKGAKAAYTHLQQAWDRGDVAELRGLCTDHVFAELQQQIRQRVGENRTELLKVEAEVLEVRDTGNDREASVLFNVLMREAAGEPPTQVQEVWHFTRSRNSSQPTWFLDGIQQLEA
jgi:predicted lipid-binding transport protein (Tim44 family)